MDLLYIIGSIFLSIIIICLIVFLCKKLAYRSYKKEVEQQAQFEFDVENEKQKLYSKKNNAEK